MNANLSSSVPQGASFCRKLLAGWLIAVCSLAALPSSARTVYDAGKALRQNFQNNATPANPYTDENGGKWTYSSAADVVPFTSLGNFASSYATVDNGQLQGWGSTSSPHLKVNVTGQTLASSSFMAGDCEPIEADEMMIHPGSSGNTYMVLRFTAPEDGWYSAFASFHDTSEETTPTASSGASVAITLGGNNVLARGIVSLEGAANSTRRFDFQMPVRYMTAGTEIRFAIGNNAGSSGTVHASDATGVKVFVTKEDEGAFYDSGLAMGNNVAASPYANPYGTIADGTWYYLTAAAPAAQTAPDNVSKVATSRITTEATSSTYLKGFANAANGQSPFVLVNTSSSVQSTAVAPGELKVHPRAGDSTLKTWTVVRFRPPESGRYSASIVARDVDRANLSTYPTADGVDVYLYVADALVTNAYVSLETAVACTAHFTFDDRFLVAGEPVDIVVSPHGEVHSDATGISAIFRREPGAVYDAGKAFYANRREANTGFVFDDLLGGGAQWFLGAKTNAWCGAQFYEELTAGQVAGGAKTKWWMQGRFTAYDQYPYFVMATNGTATVDSAFGFSADLLAAAPQEFVAIVNEPGYQSSSPTLKATVPSNGIYRARSYARDLNNGGGDGVQVSVVADGHIAATSPVMRDSGGTIYETALGADHLWLKGGDRIEYVVDPLASRNCDPTGLSACYVVEDASPSAHVVNIDLVASGTSRFSPYAGRAREGWGDWNKWNALRPGAAASAVVKSCREADGITRRNVSLSITRSSGSNIATTDALTGCAMLDAAVASTGAGDAYAFTLSKLVPNAPYRLYFYGAGDAEFAVGGETKGLEEPWCAGNANAIARFAIDADANGQITGTFSATSANGAAFGGVTIVGEFPDYIPESFILVVR
jgi:hypothetical protein